MRRAGAKSRAPNFCAFFASLPSSEERDCFRVGGKVAVAEGGKRDPKTGGRRTVSVLSENRAAP